jgi:hypothetical protein
MPTHASNDSVFGGFNVFLQSKDALKDAEHGNAKCEFYLDKIIQPERSDIGMLVSLIDCEIPYSFYNVSKALGNYTLTINDETFELEDRNYNAYNIADAFNTQFISSNYCVGITMEFIDYTNKFTLQSANSFKINKTSMMKELGMGDLPQTTALYQSSQCANLSGTSSIYIESKNMLLNNVNSFGKTFNVLSKILVDASPSSFIYYQPNQPQYFVLSNSLNHISIELKNDDGQYIDFNSVEWSCTLSFEFYRKRDDIINTKHLLDYPTYGKDAPAVLK